MRNIKRLASILMVLVMVFAMATTVMADTTDSTETMYTISVSSTNKHTYEVYQIFTGDLSDDGTLSNVVWGKNGKYTTGSVDATILGKLAGVKDNTGETAKLEMILPYVNLSSEAFTTVNNEASAKVPAGYYLIKDTDSLPKDEGKEYPYDAYTLYIVRVSDEILINPKSDVPEIEKKVIDVNDSTTSEEEEEKWEDSADYDITDDVPFKITATLPSNFEDYEKYTLTFIDTMCKGLTYNEDAVVTFGDTDITPDAENIKTETTADGETVLTITFDDLTSVEGLTNSSAIVLKYTAELNSEAAIGDAGNINTVKMQFSNDPNWTADPDNNPDTPTPDDHPEEPKGETPEDTVIVFTYQTIINKVDGGKTAPDNALAGAAFKLEKKNADGSWKLVKEYEAGNTTTFTFTGLDDGDYKLTETVTPAGYNTVDPIEFTITAEHTITSATPALTKLESSNNTFEVNLEAGTLTTEVVNNRGSVLPETGGIGTTIFYILGGVLVVAAVVLLVTKKRMSAQ